MRLPSLTRRRLLALGAALSLEMVTARQQRPLLRAAAPVTVPVYLTFDDGVETDGGKGQQGPTLDVLNILDARGIQATFFVHGRNIGPAEGKVLARMVRNGHHLGNHLVQQGGVTLAETSRPAYIARMFLETELRIRQALARFPDALSRYEAQPHLFRRPGGGYDSAEGNLFLLPTSGYWRLFEYDRELAAYREQLPWLRGVYDYSGWHIAAPPLHETSSDPARLVWWLMDGPGGFRSFVQPDPARPELTTQEALDGLIVLLHDPDPRVAAALPALLDALQPFNVTFHPLPRPCDRPNQYTVGVGGATHPVLVSGTANEGSPIP
jgi:peptidoglycan/xylan/chitin deacetylase (PgdA/CDA1 family)